MKDKSTEIIIIIRKDSRKLQMNILDSLTRTHVVKSSKLHIFKTLIKKNPKKKQK